MPHTLHPRHVLSLTTMPHTLHPRHALSLTGVMRRSTKSVVMPNMMPANMIIERTCSRVLRTAPLVFTTFVHLYNWEEHAWGPKLPGKGKERGNCDIMRPKYSFKKRTYRQKDVPHNQDLANEGARSVRPVPRCLQVYANGQGAVIRL